MEQWYVDTMTTRAEWVSSLIQAYIIICIFIALLHPSSPCPSLSPVFSSFSTTSGGVTIPAVSSNSFALATNTYPTASTFPNLNIPSGTFSILASVYNDCGYGGASWASNPGGIGATLTCSFTTPLLPNVGSNGNFGLVTPSTVWTTLSTPVSPTAYPVGGNHIFNWDPNVMWPYAVSANKSLRVLS